MAYWQRRRSGQVMVYVYNRLTRRPCALPRSSTAFLDHQTDDYIDQWIESFAQDINSSQKPPTVVRDAATVSLVEAYLLYLHKRGKHPNTVANMRKALLDRVVPFFISVGITDLSHYPTKSAQMLTHLEKTGVGFDNIRRANTALSGWWNWLQDEGIIEPQAAALRIRKPVRLIQQETPLKQLITPEDIIAFAKNAKDAPILGFIALCGYFFSLRTLEVLALERGDFRAGSGAASLECCRTMEKAGLFNRLALKLERSAGATKELKTSASRAWVACFNEEAANLIVAYLNSLPSPRIYPLTADAYMGKWGRHQKECAHPLPGKPTLKDLRRASLYWLGHNTALTPFDLRAHARHTKMDTTMLYVRRPEEMLEERGDLLEL